MPIVVLFYQENGLNLQNTLSLQAIYSVAIILLEVPSGYLADVWGRRNTLILGAFLGVIGFSVYSCSSNFYGFLTAQLILGTGQSFISGSDSALLYDTLKVFGKEKEYVKYEGRLLSIGNFAETIAAILGGLLAEISLRTPFYWQILVTALAIPAAFSIVEPQLYSGNKNMGIKHIFSIVKLSIFKSRQLFTNIFFSAVIGCATLSMAWFLQAYLVDVQGFSEYQIGIAWSVLNLTVGISTILAYQIEKKLGRKATIFMILFITSFAYILIGSINSIFVFIIIWLFYFTRGVATPVLKNYINELCEPNVRATILSIRNLVIRLLFAVFGPFIGWFADVYTIQQAFILSGILCLIIGSFAFILYIPFLKNNK